MKHRNGGWTLGARAVLVVGMSFLQVHAEPPVAPPSSAPATEPKVDGQLDPGTPGAIQGLVLESERPQPYLGVVLLAANGSEVGSTRTDGKGSFLFQRVTPGNYRVVCRKEESSGPAVGFVRVAVQPGRVQAAIVRLGHPLFP